MYSVTSCNIHICNILCAWLTVSPCLLRLPLVPGGIQLIQNGPFRVEFWNLVRHHCDLYGIEIRYNKALQGLSVLGSGL